MAGQPGKHEKDPVNIVHQNAILCETIMKEQRHQKLYTSYNVNPYKKSNNIIKRMSVRPFLRLDRLLRSCLVYTLSGKPNSTHDSEDGVPDGKFFVFSFEACMGWERLFFHRKISEDISSGTGDSTTEV